MKNSMHNVVTLGGQRLDTAKEVDRLIAAHAVYFEKDEIEGIYTDIETVPSPEDQKTAEWLIAISMRLPEQQA